MIDISAEPRQRFMADVLAHITDLGLMARWVLEYEFPVPEPDPFISGAWVVFVALDSEFDRLAHEIVCNGVLEVEEHEKFRIARYHIGSISLEVTQVYAERDAAL